jgi:hypothetical protein
VTIETDKVVTKYEANVDQHRAQLELLRSQQQAFAATVLKGLESQNKALTDTISKYAKFTAGVGAAVSAMKFLKGAMDESAKHARLSAAAGGADIEKLRKSSEGLVTDMKLLKLAAEANHGAFRLNTQQMNTAAKAMAVLIREGKDSEQVFNKVTEAIAKGAGGGLDDFGIIVKEAKTDLEKFNALMDGLAAKAGQAGQTPQNFGDEWQRAGVKFDNSMERMKVALGKLAVAFEPVITLIADALGGVMDLVDRAATPVSTIGENVKSAQTEADIKRLFAEIEQKMVYGAVRGRNDYPTSYWETGKIQAQPISIPFLGFTPGQSPFWADLMTRKKTGGGGRRRTISHEDDVFGNAANLGELGPDFDSGVGSLGMADLGGYTTQLRAGVEQSSRGGRYSDFAARQSQKKLAGMFGPIEDFNLYARAFDMLSGSVASAMDAWITGSMSAGAAIKRFIGEALRGAAIEMGVMALKHGAYAIGSLAFGDVRGAAMHGKSAAMFAGGAIAAAIGAKALGAGAEVPKPQAAPTGAGAPGGGDGGRTTVVVYGNDFSDDSPRKRAQIARTTVRRGLQDAQTGIEYR